MSRAASAFPIGQMGLAFIMIGCAALSIGTLVAVMWWSGRKRR